MCDYKNKAKSEKLLTSKLDNILNLSNKFLVKEAATKVHTIFFQRYVGFTYLFFALI